MIRSMFFSVLLSVCALYGWGNPTQQFVEELESHRTFRSHSALVKHYRNIFDREIAWIEEQVCNVAQITRAELHRRYRQSIDYYQSPQAKEEIKRRNNVVVPHPRIERLAHEVFRDFDMPADTAIYAGYRPDARAFAWTNAGNMVFVDEGSIAHFSDDHIKMIISHEVQHLLHHDPERGGVINHLVGEHSQLALRCTQLQETRADTLAMAHSSYYAKCWKRLDDMGMFGSDAEHLTPEQRMAINHVLRKQLKGLSQLSKFNLFVHRAMSPLKQFFKQAQFRMALFWQALRRKVRHRHA